MKHQNHTPRSATAAIAAAFALSATPLAAQDAAAPVIASPAAQAEPAPVEPAEPAPVVVASPAPVVVIPEAAVPAASGAAASGPVAEPAPTMTTTVATTTAPKAVKTARTTETRTTRAAAPAATAPVAAVPPPANDVALPPADTNPAETSEAAPMATDLAPPAAPTPAQTENVIGTLGLILLGLVALAIFAFGVLFVRRRNPVMAESIEDPLVTRPVAEPPVAEPVAAADPVAAPTMLRRRDLNPVSGALPSDGAAVDLPAVAPASYEERAALFERMVAARPDRANPFTDRKARLHRARLILQSLGTTFEREPCIDLSQYPNNWPELRRQYHKAA